MSIIIKNALVTTEKGSYRADVAVKEDKIITLGPGLKVTGDKEIDASKVISESILNWFNS